MDDGGGGSGGVDHDRAARRRRRRWWTLAAAGVLLVAGIVLLSVLGRRYEPPWTVWAVRTSAPGVTPPTFGRVSATVGGEDLSGEWDAFPAGTFAPGASTCMVRREPMGLINVLELEFRGDTSEGPVHIYQALDAERADDAGATWVRFVAGANSGLKITNGVPDPRCVGTWEVAGEHGGVERFRLDPDGGFQSEASGWRVQDGVLRAQFCRPDGKWVEIVGVLDDAGTSFVGIRDSWPVTGRKVAE